MNHLELGYRGPIDRRLSSFEYGHAAAGSSPKTLDPARIVTLVLEGESGVTPRQWMEALRAVTEVNPGLRLRIEGVRQRARWTSTGVGLPEVRIVENCTWDGLSHRGLDAIGENSLPLHSGPGLELVIATGKITRVVLRVQHAIMDGAGAQHFFEELFRALRGEPLIGTNAGFSDVDLMRSVAGTGGGFGSARPLALTGGAHGTSRSDVWQRLTVPARQYPNLIGQIAETAARYAWTFRTGPVRIAVPVDLRRHLPGLKSTMNYAGMVYVELNTGEGAGDFRRRLRERLAQHADAAYPQMLEGLRYLPLHWVDRLTGRTPRNYLRRNLMETVLISNLGRLESAALGCARFRAHNYYGLPVMGNSHIIVTTCGANLNLVVGMPEVYASEDRLQRFITLLRERLGGDRQTVTFARSRAQA